MADTRSRPVSDRWESIIDERRRQEERRENEDRETRRRHIDRLARPSLLSDDNVPRLSGPQPSVFELEANWDGRNYARHKRRLTSNQSAPLPTPPASPLASRSSVPLPRALDENENYDVTACRQEVEAQQSLITSLEAQLEEKETECERLREEQQQVFRQRRHAIIHDNSEEIEKLKKREKNLQDTLDEREDMIAELQEDLRESRKRERDMQRQLAEAEARLDEKDRELQRSETAIAEARLEERNRQRQRSETAIAEARNDERNRQLQRSETAMAEALIDARERWSQRSETVCYVREPREESLLSARSGRSSNRMLEGDKWRLSCPRGERTSGIEIARDIVRRSRR